MKEEKRRANMRDRVIAANSHSKWEWADKMSSAEHISKKVVLKEKTSRKRKARNEQPLREQRE
jgi:hypothetical protein